MRLRDLHNDERKSGGACLGPARVDHVCRDTGGDANYRVSAFAADGHSQPNFRRRTDKSPAE
jgi:hypothetical protein